MKLLSNDSIHIIHGRGIRYKVEFCHNFTVNSDSTVALAATKGVNSMLNITEVL